MSVEAARAGSAAKCEWHRDKLDIALGKKGWGSFTYWHHVFSFQQVFDSAILHTDSSYSICNDKKH